MGISSYLSKLALGISTEGILGTSKGGTGTTVYVPGSGTSSSPTVTSITYTGDDTATNVAGGDTVTINGTNFAIGVNVLIGEVQVNQVTRVSATQLTFAAPANVAGSYIIYVINPDGSAAISVPGIQYSGVPAWNTVAGSLGTSNIQTSFSTTLAATGDAPISYAIVSGSLPAGINLNTASGVISGTTSANTSTTYNFTVRATDAQNQDTTRAFSLTITPVTVYSATPIAFSINEGSPLTVNVSGENITDGIYYWTINSNASDFATSSGSFTITSNVGSFSVTPIADTTTEGSEVFTISIRSVSTTGTVLTTTTTITITDSSTTPNPTYSITPSASNIDEGSVLTFNVSGTYIVDGTYYWTTTNAADFATSSGSFAITSNAGSFTVTPTSDTTTEGVETFTASVRASSIAGTILATSSAVTINDTSVPATTAGETEYTTPGTYQWTAPAGVTSVCVVAVGGGGGGNRSVVVRPGDDDEYYWSGGGGALAYKNNITVIPGQAYEVIVGAAGTFSVYGQFNTATAGGDSSFGSGQMGQVVKAGGGKTSTNNAPYSLGALGGQVLAGDGGGAGGRGGNYGGNYGGGVNPGAGGAGGYSGAGGAGGDGQAASSGLAPSGAAGSGGGGGGGAAAGRILSPDTGAYGGSGGGVGIYGEGSSGGGGYNSNYNTLGGVGGSGGNNGVYAQGPGGEYGGGGSFDANGGKGAVRIIWGTGRAFPSTNVAKIVPIAPGEIQYTTPDTHYFTVPAGVTSINALAVGGGGAGGQSAGTSASAGAGGGGGLSWRNSIPVTPGESLTITIGPTATGGSNYIGTSGTTTYIKRGTTELLSANGGSGGAGNNGTRPWYEWVGGAGGAGGANVNAAYGGGNGGKGGNGTTNSTNRAGGGGAGGYTGTGGAGGNGGANPINLGSAGTGGGGGGGASSPGSPYSGGGGGVGLYGQGTNGAGGTNPNVSPYTGSAGGSGGSGGTNAGYGGYVGSYTELSGGFAGGGGAGSDGGLSGTGAPGAVRIMWGANRAFPSTSAEQIFTTGDAVGGGFYVGKMSINGNGVATHHLIVSDISTRRSTLSWDTRATGNSGFVSGVNDPINGPQNTTSLAGQGSYYEAAIYCQNLDSGGYTDWYLPSIQELQMCYYYLKPSTEANHSYGASYGGANPYAVAPQPINTEYVTAGPSQTTAFAFRNGNAQSFGTSGYYSSCESTHSLEIIRKVNAQVLYFTDGSQSTINKSQTWAGAYTRAVRRIPI
jgi:hypothetical protein